MLTLRDAAVRKLDVVLNAPAPGGEEQKALTAVPVTDATIRSHFSSLTVSNTKSEYDQIRDKIIKSSKKFLSNRLNIEQEKCVQLDDKCTFCNNMCDTDPPLGECFKAFH